MKREAPWSRIKRKTVTSEPVYLKRFPGKSVKFIVPVVLLAIFVAVTTVLRIPERIGLLQQPTPQEVEVSVHLTAKYLNLVEELLECERTLDWDGDGLDNGADPHPWDIDSDRNGIPDGLADENFLSGELPIRYGNVDAVVRSTKDGFVRYRGSYYFASPFGWVAFFDETGTPYLFHDGEWSRAEFERIDGKCYVNIPAACRICFTDGAKPDERTVSLPIEKAECTAHPDERYSVANAPLVQLSGIYDAIDRGKTVQIGILAEGGEQILLIYGYDGQGNLFAADPETLTEQGKVQIYIRSQIFYSHGEIRMREWFDFSWGSLNSENGNVLTVF